MGARVFAVQGKFDWQECKQLTAQQASLTKRITDLKELMAKAERGGGGGFVNATVHQPTLTGLEADRRLTEETLVEKNCDKSSEPAGRAASRR